MERFRELGKLRQDNIKSTVAKREKPIAMAGSSSSLGCNI